MDKLATPAAHEFKIGDRITIGGAGVFDVVEIGNGWIGIKRVSFWSKYPTWAYAVMGLVGGLVLTHVIIYLVTLWFR